MFCCKCGAQNPDDGSYCFKCGEALYKEVAAETREQPTISSQQRLTEEERQFISELLPIDQKPHKCHVCGKTANLFSWDFGLGKEVSTKRAWGETAWSVAVSVVTLPLIGVGGVNWPEKKTRLRVLRLKLILCSSCRDTNFVYSFHPWWEPARRLGYTNLLNADELNKLETVR